jgi:chromosome segregation ATPase
MSREKCRQLEDEVTDLRDRLYASGREIEHERASAQQSVSELQSDIQRLAESLAASEKRTLDLAAENAKIFAEKSEEVLSAQSECEQLNELIKHLRQANNQLSEDTRVLNAEVASLKSLENRYLISQGEQDALRDRIAELEEDCRQKDEANLAAMREALDNDAERQQQHEDEVEELRRLIAAAKVQLNSMCINFISSHNNCFCNL